MRLFEAEMENLPHFDGCVLLFVEVVSSKIESMKRRRYQLIDLS